MQEQLVIGNLFIAPQMLDARAEQIARAPHDPVDRVPFLQEKLGQIRTVLSRNSTDQRYLVRILHGETLNVQLSTFNCHPRCRGRWRNPVVGAVPAAISVAVLPSFCGSIKLLGNAFGRNSRRTTRLDEPMARGGEISAPGETRRAARDDGRGCSRCLQRAGYAARARLAQS